MVQETFPNVIYALFLQDFPESLVLVLLIFSLAKIKHQTKPILCIALLQALTSVAMRQIPIVFGVHSENNGYLPHSNTGLQHLPVSIFGFCRSSSN